MRRLANAHGKWQKVLAAGLAVVMILGLVPLGPAAPGPAQASETATIAAARDLGVGVTTAVYGIVTTTPGIYGSKAFAIQDDTGGLYAYTGTDYGLAVGDQVYVAGTLKSYNGLLEFDPVTNVAKQSGGHDLPAVQSVTASEFSTNGENYESELVQLASVTLGEITKANSYGTVELSVSDATGTAQVYIDNRTGVNYDSFVAQYAVGDVLDITGLASDYNGTYEVKPRGAADLVEVIAELEVTAAVAIAADQVKVSFNHALDAASAENAANYSIAAGAVTLEVTAAELLADSQSVRLTTEAQTPGTSYTVTVTEVTDSEGHALGAGKNTATFTGFTPLPGEYTGPVQVYHGDLHLHTGVSQDGQGDPADALDALRQNGLDFVGLSDHSYAITDGEWEYEGELVKDWGDGQGRNEDGQFVVIRGFEYTHGSDGHLNVFNAERRAIRTTSYPAGVTEAYADLTPDLQSFYQWVEDNPEALVQFNHPGWMNFQDFLYVPSVEEQVQLQEVGNGFGDSYTWTEEAYRRALDYGWRVGATNNSDYHGTQGTNVYGLVTASRTGVLLPEAENDGGLTRENLLAAIKAMRTFATEDTNFAITMKADGKWMGSLLDNDGELDFEITYDDPDGETLTSLELVGDKGRVWGAASGSDLTDGIWNPSVSIGPGAYYFYVRAVQADGDRIVTSPVWTSSQEDVSVTDITLQPALPTTEAPGVVTARITNRGLSDAANLQVKLIVNGAEVSTQTVTARKMATTGAADMYSAFNGDTFVEFSWQPEESGANTIRVEIAGTPAGDNLDDNYGEVTAQVTGEDVPLVIIDAAHNNFATAGDEMGPFMESLAKNHINTVKNLDELTAADLASAQALVITAPMNTTANNKPYSQAEIATIAAYVGAGGRLWLSGISDYDDGDANQELNAILAAIPETAARFNDDEVVDGNNNNGYPWGVWWHVFPNAETTGVGLNVANATSWSEPSLVDENYTALTEADGVILLATGDLDEGQTGEDKNATHNIEADDKYGGSMDDAYLYEPWDDGIPLPLAAGQELDGGGRIIYWASSQDTYDSWAYRADNGTQNEILNVEAVRWLLGEPIQKVSIAEARAQDGEDQPRHLGEMVWVEGTVTARFQQDFMDVFYIQDATGGLTVYAPVSRLATDDLPLGALVRVVGNIDLYEGDVELQLSESEQVQVLSQGSQLEPRVFSTRASALEENEGWYLTTAGTVTEVWNAQNFFINDGSGASRVFLDYTPDSDSQVQVGDQVTVVGYASEDTQGQRIRVARGGVTSGSAPAGVKIAVFADPHYFAPELLEQPSEPFDAYLAQDRKLLAESAAIARAAVDAIKASDVQIVLVPGDLTKDGELLSHRQFAALLAELEAAGKKVYVIDGNHDLNNPGAYKYEGDIRTPVENVSPAEFKSIYAAFGYGEAIASDPNSLSYVVEPVPGLRLVAMDSALYDPHQGAGALDAERLGWITEQVSAAVAQGKTVLGMMHHGLIDHFSVQRSYFPDYVVRDADQVAAELAASGLRVVFTGHFHAQDIVQKQFGGKTLYDIETGSLVTYPSPYRIVELTPDHELKIATHRIESIDYDTGGKDFPTYARAYLVEGLNGLVPQIVASILMEQGLPQEQALQQANAMLSTPVAGDLTAKDLVVNAMVSHYQGDETIDPQLEPAIQAMAASTDPLTSMLGQVLLSLGTDPAPADNDLTIDLAAAPAATYPAEINSISPVDQDDQAVGRDSLVASDQYYLILEARNLSDAALPAMAVLEVLDARQQVTFLNAVQTGVPAGETATYRALFTPSAAGSYRLRGLLWNGWSTDEDWLPLAQDQEVELQVK